MSMVVKVRPRDDPPRCRHRDERRRRVLRKAFDRHHRVAVAERHRAAERSREDARNCGDAGGNRFVKDKVRATTLLRRVRARDLGDQQPRGAGDADRDVLQVQQALALQRGADYQQRGER